MQPKTRIHFKNRNAAKIATLKKSQRCKNRSAGSPILGAAALDHGYSLSQP